MDRRAARAPPHDREMPALGAAGEVALGPVRRDGLDTVDPAVDVLKRHDKPSARIHAQGERLCLLGDQIGMVGGRRAGGGPDPRGAGGGIVRWGSCRSGIVIGARLGRFRVRFRQGLARIVRRHCP